MGMIALIVFGLLLLMVAGGLLFLWFYPSVGNYPDGKECRSFADRTDLFFDGQFHNEEDVRTMSGEGYPSSGRRVPKEMLPAEKPELLSEADKKDLSVTWLGHSSFLLQTGGKNILVDPVLSRRSSPVSFVGPKRFSEIPIHAEEMPEIDILLLSHDHYDHMDDQKDVR